MFKCLLIIICVYFTFAYCVPFQGYNNIRDKRTPQNAWWVNLLQNQSYIPEGSQIIVVDATEQKNSASSYQETPRNGETSSVLIQPSLNVLEWTQTGNQDAQPSPSRDFNPYYEKNNQVFTPYTEKPYSEFIPQNGPPQPLLNDGKSLPQDYRSASLSQNYNPPPSQDDSKLSPPLLQEYQPTRSLASSAYAGKPLPPTPQDDRSRPPQKENPPQPQDNNYDQATPPPSDIQNPSRSSFSGSNESKLSDSYNDRGPPNDWGPPPPRWGPPHHWGPPPHHWGPPPHHWGPPPPRYWGSYYDRRSRYGWGRWGPPRGPPPHWGYDRGPPRHWGPPRDWGPPHDRGPPPPHHWGPPPPPPRDWGRGPPSPDRDPPPPPPPPPPDFGYRTGDDQYDNNADKRPTSNRNQEHGIPLVNNDGEEAKQSQANNPSNLFLFQAMPVTPAN